MMFGKEYYQVIGDAMEECNAEREHEECMADAPDLVLTDEDLDAWYKGWRKRNPSEVDE